MRGEEAQEGQGTLKWHSKWKFAQDGPHWLGGYQVAPSCFFFSFISLGLELSDTKKSTSLKYEPSSELRLITAQQLFLNRVLDLCLHKQLPCPEVRLPWQGRTPEG